MLRRISIIFSGGSTIIVKVRYVIINSGLWIAKLMSEQNLFVGMREGLAMFLNHLQQVLLLFLLIGYDTVEWLYQWHTKHRCIVHHL